jgi:hypothetical protein
MAAAHEEHLMILGLIGSERFLRQFLSLDPLPLIDSRIFKTIAQLCASHFEQHQVAPGRGIQDLWRIYREDSDEDESKLDLVEKTIEKVLTEYEAGQLPTNDDYVLSVAEKYLKLRKLKRLSDDLRAAVTGKDADVGDQAIVQYTPVRFHDGGGAGPMDRGYFMELFEDEDRPLFRLSGPLGQLMNSQLRRTRFIALFGSAKVSKSWALQELAMTAWWQRCNVAYFVVGDMSMRDVKERMAQHMTKKQSKKYRKEGLIKLYHRNGNGIEWEEKEVEAFGLTDVLNAEEGWKKKVKGKHLRIDCFPSGSKSIRDLEGVLDNWQHFYTFVPDLVVIDYADLLSPIRSRGDNGERNEINETWTYMRALAQRRNCLVITATQGDADSYGKRKIGMRNFSGDRRKNDHVTALYGLTQTEEDKKEDRVVVEEILVRHGQAASKPVTVYRCLPIGKFHAAAQWDYVDDGKQKVAE